MAATTVKSTPPAVKPEASTVLTVVTGVPIRTAAVVPLFAAVWAVPVAAAPEMVMAVSAPVLKEPVKPAAALIVNATEVAGVATAPMAFATVPVELTTVEVNAPPVKVIAEAPRVPPEMFKVAAPVALVAYPAIKAPFVAKLLPITPADEPVASPVIVMAEVARSALIAVMPVYVAAPIVVTWPAVVCSARTLMVSMPVILAAGIVTAVFAPVTVTLKTSLPRPPVRMSPAVRVSDVAAESLKTALNTSALLPPVTVSVPVVSGRIVTLKKVNQISSL